MKRAILASVSVLVLCGIVSGYELEVSWIRGEIEPDFSIVPDNPTTEDLIHFSMPTDIYANQWVAEWYMDGTPTLSIDSADKTIKLRSQGPPPEDQLPLLWAPVCGLEGYFGPLEEGSWLFDVQLPGIIWWVDINVNPPDPNIGGVKAEYFAGNIPQGIPCLTLIEPRIDNNWGNNVVACDRRDEVSARWTADLAIPVTDTYTFYTTSDDGVRLYLDRQRIIDDWTGYGVRDNNSPPLALVGGRVYPLVMEWYDSGGGAVAQLYWETPRMARQIIPSGPLQPPQPPLPPDDGGAGPVVETEGFEHFTDDVAAGMAIFQTWIGGGHPDDPDVDNSTGMTVGHLDRPYAEQTIVYSGEQSMPLYYDNSKPPFYSQADRTWDRSQNWTAEGIIALHMQIHGRPGNDPDPFYVRVEDTAGNAGVVFNPDPEVLLSDGWTGWWIPLSDFANAGVDMTRVKTMSIGMGEPPDQEPDGMLNDDCFNAIPIGNVTNLAFDTTLATFDGPGHCVYSSNIWCIYTAPQTCKVTVSLLGSDFDTKLAVYDGSSCNPAESDLIDCNDDISFYNLESAITFDATAGNDYLIEVGGYSAEDIGDGVISIYCEGQEIGAYNGEAGQGMLNISSGWGPSEPLNDDCHDAKQLGNVTNLAFETTSATFDGPGHYMTSPNIWYCYTATCTGDVTVDLCDSSYDTKLAVYKGCSCYPTSSDMIASSDDDCAQQSRVTFAATAGEKFLIEVGGYGSRTGPGVLTISCEGDLASPILSDGPKLLDNHNPEPGGEGEVNADQVILVGTGPGILWGYVKDDFDVGIPNVRFTLVLQTLEFWGETRDTGLYKVDAIQGKFDCTVTKENLSVELPSVVIDKIRKRKDYKILQSSWTSN